MAIRVISVGKTNIDFVQAGIGEYLNRLKHYTKLTWTELPDVKKVDRTDQEQLKRKEGEAFLHIIEARDTVVLLDEKGKSVSSEGFAGMIEQFQLYEQGDLVFVIGGAYGFSEAMYDRANRKLSLSALTFNHQMVRMILAEQLYRAFSIIRGEPYHHS
ncbi:MAG: 23S rRNA (pseudouridine(1915)-N(3))-methyltransferase RlmH [Flavobacteriales bacterium]|nr:23S rRNA (pseudouridine(1915)-N(3))-methyltransferase RlmH [Flavobacteriales bacterium]